MTRGQIAIVLGDKIYTSNEFNGGMYRSGHGRAVVAGLKKINDLASYEYFVAKFNFEHHHYNDLEKVVYKEDKEEYANFKDDYFEKWFSDYIYIKNLNNHDETFITESGKTKTLKPNQIGCFYFGKAIKIYG